MHPTVFSFDAFAAHERVTVPVSTGVWLRSLKTDDGICAGRAGGVG